MYQYIRAGKLEEAESYCHEHDESWRVASINGGKAWGIDVIVGGTSRVLLAYVLVTHRGLPADVDMEGDGSEAVVTGNMRRDLWKKTCKAIATNVRIHARHRAGSSIQLTNPIIAVLIIEAGASTVRLSDR